MEENNQKSKLDYLKRLEYLQKQELKTRFAIKISKEEDNKAALTKFTNDMEKIQAEIDTIIDNLIKDTQIREKYMKQLDKLNYEEVKASFGIKIAKEENNPQAVEFYEKNLIKARVAKKGIEDKLNSSQMLNESNEEKSEKSKKDDDEELRQPIRNIQTVNIEKKESILNKLKKFFKNKFRKRNKQKLLPKGYIDVIKQNITKEEAIKNLAATKGTNTLYLDGPTKEEKKGFVEELKFNESKNNSKKEIQNLEYMIDIENNVSYIHKTDDDMELAEEYKNDETNDEYEDKKVAQDYENGKF